MDETFEEKYEDVLQNIEFALVNVYREHDEMTDWEALHAVEALIRAYQAEARAKPAPTLELKPLVQKAYDRARDMCEWRLGRAALYQDDEGRPLNMGQDAKTVDEIIVCLKRVRRSIEHWQKRGGRRGYFGFVSEFLP
ncbi:MAG: hypothetical protein HY260_12415 [Chloroflexi bacterium]|nr:hypothetical protein [Chloroflexota bacterium]